MIWVGVGDGPELIAIWRYYTEWYTVRPKLEMVLEDFERSVDQTKGCWQIGVFYLFNLLPSNKPIPAKHLWRECRNITKKNIIYIYILFMSLQLRVYVSYCKAETRTTDLHDLHQYHQSNRFGIVSLTRCTSFGETCWCPRKAMCHDSAGQNRITRPVPKAVAICPTWCLHFSMLFLCEVWSGKIWCWIWTLADRCGSLLRIPANSLMWCASIRGTCWIAGTS